MAPEVQSLLVLSGTVGKGNVVIGNVIEEVDLVPRQHKASGNRVNRGVPPSLVKKAAILIQHVEVVGVRNVPEPIQAANLEVGPLCQEIVNEGWRLQGRKTLTRLAI